MSVPGLEGEIVDLRLMIDPRLRALEIHIMGELGYHLKRHDFINDARVAEIDPDTDVLVVATNVPGTYEDLQGKVRAALAGLAPAGVKPERVRVEVHSSNEEWE